MPPRELLNIENVSPLTEAEVNAIIAEMKPRDGESDVEFDRGAKKIMEKVCDEVTAGGDFRITADALRKSWQIWKIYYTNKDPMTGMFNGVNNFLGARGTTCNALSVPKALEHLAERVDYMDEATMTKAKKRKKAPELEPKIDIENVSQLTESEVNAIIAEIKPRERESDLEFRFGAKKIMERVRDEVTAGGDFRITVDALRKSW